MKRLAAFGVLLTISSAIAQICPRIDIRPYSVKASDRFDRDDHGIGKGEKDGKVITDGGREASIDRRPQNNKGDGRARVESDVSRSSTVIASNLLNQITIATKERPRLRIGSNDVVAHEDKLGLSWEQRVAYREQLLEKLLNSKD
jgi:hypothetical protein